MAEKRVGIIGATSLVGASVLSSLSASSWRVVAFSRKASHISAANIKWQVLRDRSGHGESAQREGSSIPYWICLAPIWVLPEYFGFLEEHHAQRIIVLSSTSRFTKLDSNDSKEKTVASRIENAEIEIQTWAKDKNIILTILRPTLIYGHGRDKNITEIARFIQRFRFFPLLGKGSGLRQPIHADDVAVACLAALNTNNIPSRSYNITGGEAISYRDMVCRIFTALNYPVRFIHVPLVVFRVAVAFMRILPAYRNWSPEMALRMNSDMVFDGSEAADELGFSPRRFNLTKVDLPTV